MDIALVHIQLTPLGPGLPSPETLLFNHQLRGILSILCKLPISPNNDDELYEALVKRQTKRDKNHDTPRNYGIILIESTVVVQWEDGGPWTQGIVVGKGDNNENNILSTICVTKTGQVLTRKRKHVKTTQITAEQWL